MAKAVQRAQKKQNGLGELLPIAGAVVGGVLGAGAGGVGAVPGALAGSQLGSLAGGVVDPQEAPAPGVAAAQRAQQPSPANVGVPEVEDPEVAIRNAQVALANLPQPVQQELGPALMMGQRAFQQKRESQV